MAPHNKSLLLSLFVFPGIGYFTVNEKRKAYVFITVALISLSAITYNIYFKVSAIVKKIETGEIPNDITIIMEKLQLIEGYFSENLMTVLAFALLIAWLGSAVDGYRLGKKLNQ